MRIRNSAKSGTKTKVQFRYLYQSRNFFFWNQNWGPTNSMSLKMNSDLQNYLTWKNLMFGNIEGEQKKSTQTFLFKSGSNNLTGRRRLTVTYHCCSKFLNQIFYSSFIRVGLSKLTQPTWHPWVHPVGSETNLKVRIQQMWSLLRTKKYDTPCKISYSTDVTQKLILHSPLTHLWMYRALREK